MEELKIFIHEPGKFMYFSEQDQMPNNYRLTMKDLKYFCKFFLLLKDEIFRRNHENIFNLKKEHHTYK